MGMTTESDGWRAGGCPVEIVVAGAGSIEVFM
jgi:hypothetical protein